MADLITAFNLKDWIDKHRDYLKPPIGNIQVFPDTEFIIMIVGGPNARGDFHINQSEEFFYQLEGDIVLKVRLDNEIREIPIRAGDILLLPPNTPHSPQRPADTVGLVVERKRRPGEIDRLHWYCDHCGSLVHEASFELTDIVEQLKQVFLEFNTDQALRTCKKCGYVIEPAKPRE